MKDSIHGWFKPSSPIDKFLTSYSLEGGTHHAVLVYGDDKVKSEIIKFGAIMGWNVKEI